MAEQNPPDSQTIAELKKSIEEQQQKLDELTRASYAYAAPTQEADPEDLSPEVKQALEHEQKDTGEAADEARAKIEKIDPSVEQVLEYPSPPPTAAYQENPLGSQQMADSPPDSSQTKAETHEQASPQANSQDTSSSNASPSKQKGSSDSKLQKILSKTSSLKDKASQNFEKFAASEPLSPSVLNKGSIIFLALGGLFLIIMVASIIFSQSFIWPLFAIIAGLQLTMGAVLLIKS